MVGTLSQSDYRWGPSANQVTGVHARVAHGGVAHARVVGTLSQSHYTGVVRKGCVHRGCAQGLHVQGWWGHSANQITQGLHAMVAHAGVAHRGCVHKGGGDTQPISLHRGCAQGLCAQGLCTRVACTRVVGTLSQSDYTGVACNGCMCRGCMRKGGGDTQLISLHRGCVQGLHAQGLCTRVVCTGVALSQSDYTGVARNGCMCRGCVQGWWGHSVNQITQGLHARVACSRMMGTLSQSDYTGVVRKGCMCRGCVQGLHTRGVCAGVVHAGVAVCP